jgi:hypothetical protein
VNDPTRVNELIDEVQRRFGRAGVERIVHGLQELLENREIPGFVPEQRITVMRVPGLAARAYWDAETLPWASAFEAASDEILAEFHHVEAHAASPTSFEGYGRGWRAWLFASGGEWDEETRRLAPRTTALLESTPLTRGEFLFSELSPGGVIVPHSGGCNAVLSVHLALIVPSSAQIKVGSEIRGWTRGKVLAFDDSFMHGCWNPSSQRRVCLVWEVWHPELSELEREAMAMVYQQLVEE